LFEALGWEVIAISMITVAKVYEGILFGRDPEAAEARFREFLACVVVLPLDEAVMRPYACLRGALRRQVPRQECRDERDLLTAATALHHDLIVVTGNVRDVELVPELLIYKGQPANDDDF
jgi:predicted nucleic acid-binding protein